MKKLKKYSKKRDFKKTKEPKPSAQKKKKKIFVVQKHDASSLHYDFRLNISGVLVSWAVPKGPSLNPKTKRLAMQTENHPLDYADFEGTIPESEYGAGKVIIWDKGTYKNISKNKNKKILIEKALNEGKISVELKGKKLEGGFSLIKIGKKRWLLIKHNDKQADARKNVVKSQPKSVKSGKKIQEI